ncbi:3'5'-cyclic nucleotide phosphodiesterase [Kipferlia bialata]|uniref:Phosphodiesterase n=1 Tax=Kipferlia bialata TaxID=797122 RepID=A0A9K3CTP0_9EUKA|nr:3'5'-cyclic nucleotide phosphodiesterase [Kipferlia bialata]|eukprot:g3605.t1
MSERERASIEWEGGIVRDGTSAGIHNHSVASLIKVYRMRLIGVNVFWFCLSALALCLDINTIYTWDDRLPGSELALNGAEWVNDYLGWRGQAELLVLGLGIVMMSLGLTIIHSMGRPETLAAIFSLEHSARLFMHYVAKRGDTRSKLAVEFLTATYEYRELVGREGVDEEEARQRAFALFGKYLHSADQAPVIAASKASMSMVRHALTAMSLSHCTGSFASNMMRDVREGLTPEDERDLERVRERVRERETERERKLDETLAEVFQGVEVEVAAYLERMTLRSFFQSRYALVCQLLLSMDSMSQSLGREWLTDIFLSPFKKTLPEFVHPFTLGGHALGDICMGMGDSLGSINDSMRDLLAGQGDALPTATMATILDTLHGLIKSPQSQDGTFTQADRDAIIIAHYIVSSYAQVDGMGGEALFGPGTASGGLPKVSSVDGFGDDDMDLERDELDRDFVMRIFTGYTGTASAAAKTMTSTASGEGEREGEREGVRHSGAGPVYSPMTGGDDGEPRTLPVCTCETYPSTPKVPTYPMPEVPMDLDWTPSFNVFETFPAELAEDVHTIAGLPRAASYMALPCVLDAAMHRLGLYRSMRISRNRLWFFVTTLQAEYAAENPYHNSTHAADVCHMATVLMMAMKEKNDKIFGSMEMLALVLGTASHDVKHPGVDNKYLVRTEHEIATRFNDRSALENHHAQLGWGRVRDSGLLDHLSDTDKRMFRKLFVDIVLETDPAANFDFTRRNVTLHTLLPTTDWEVQGALSSFKEDAAHKVVAQTRFTLLSVIVKLADLSNPFRPTKVATVFAECVMREFFSQGDRVLVSHRTTPLLGHQDRYQYPQNMYKCQTTFIKNLVAPLLNVYTLALTSLPCDTESDAHVPVYHLPPSTSSAAAARSTSTAGLATPRVKGVSLADTLLGHINGNVAANLRHWSHCQRDRHALRHLMSDVPQSHQCRNCQCVLDDAQLAQRGLDSHHGEVPMIYGRGRDGRLVVDVADVGVSVAEDTTGIMWGKPRDKGEGDQDESDMLSTSLEEPDADAEVEGVRYADANGEASVSLGSEGSVLGGLEAKHAKTDTNLVPQQ